MDLGEGVELYYGNGFSDSEIKEVGKMIDRLPVGVINISTLDEVSVYLAKSREVDGSYVLVSGGKVKYTNMSQVSGKKFSMEMVPCDRVADTIITDNRSNVSVRLRI